MTDKPSSNEEEFFLRHDAELVKELRAKRDAERHAAERKTHFMKCPKCGASLQEAKTHHVSVDICTECGGMWLDAGELDMLRKVNEPRFGKLFNDLLSALPGRK